jgi:hypothetical protein
MKIGRDEPQDAEPVAFHGTGEAARGEYHCTSCGYGISVQSVLPTCPMCAGEEWEWAGPVRGRPAFELQH